MASMRNAAPKEHKRLERRPSLILTADVCDELAREELVTELSSKRYEKAYENVFGFAQRRNSTTLPGPLDNFAILRRYGSDPYIMGFLG